LVRQGTGKKKAVAVGSSVWSGSPGVPVTEQPSNAVSVAVPAGRYTEVVRLVVGGFVSRILGYEAVDDVQLALEAVVRAVPVDGTHIRVSLANDGSWLTVAVGGFEAGTIEQRLGRVVNDDIELGSLLGHLVDTVEVDDGARGSIVMRKRLPSRA
jgi:hypothetical protein